MDVKKRSSFLNVEVEKLDGTFETGLSRKEIFSGFSTKYFSALPIRFNLIQCLLIRAFKMYFYLENLTLSREFWRTFFQKQLFSSFFDKQRNWRNYWLFKKYRCYSVCEKWVFIVSVRLTVTKLTVSLKIICSKNVHVLLHVKVWPICNVPSKY